MLKVTGATARLPPELLAMIFEQTFWLCDGDRLRSKTRGYLSATCSRWRNVALSSRILWSSIYLDTAFCSLWVDLIDTSLERSGSSSLTLTIMDNWTSAKVSFPGGLDARLAAVFPRTRSFRAWCLRNTLFALEICVSTPTPELQDFDVTAMDVTAGDVRRAFLLPFLSAAPKLKVLKWADFRFQFPIDGLLRIPSLTSVSLDVRGLDELAALVHCAPHIEKAIMRVEASLPPRPFELPSLLDLELTCPDAAYALALPFPALRTAVINLTRSPVLDLRGLAAFAQLNGTRLRELSLSFAGDFSGLAAALEHCAEVRTLRLGEIGWSTSFVASFLRDMAAPDENGNWVCARLEELELRVVQLESAVRTALVNLAEARRADERPGSPLRSIRVVRSDNAVDTARRNHHAALNKRLGDILATQSALY